jgi:putative ABC transport system substrate-binding protein
MRRRVLLNILAGLAIWPQAAIAQQATLPLIGFLRSSSIDDAAALVSAFRAGLQESGFIEGQNVAIEFRSADDHTANLPPIIEDLLRRRVAVLVGNATAVRAAKAMTAAVPIVFASGSDPSREDIVASFNQPEANITGISFFNSELGAKKLELIRDLVAGAGPIGVLANPHSPGSSSERRDVEATGRATGQDILALNTATEYDFEVAFAALVRARGRAMLVTGDALFLSRRDRLIALAARFGVPVIYSERLIVEDGGLVSYGASITDAYRQAGLYAGRILKGERPGQLPVMRATRFELVINLKTAAALGLAVPDTLLARADTVIE